MSEHPEKFKKINLDEILRSLSDETKSGMTWSIDDHKFNVKILDAHTQAVGETIEGILNNSLDTFKAELWKELTEYILNRNQGIMNQLKVQTKLLREFKKEFGLFRKDIDELRCRVEKLEKAVFK